MSLANKVVAALQALLIIPRSPRFAPFQIEHGGGHADGIPEPKLEVSLTNVKNESGLKRERSVIDVGDDDDDEVIFVSAAKRARPNISVNANGVEIIDLT